MLNFHLTEDQIQAKKTYQQWVDQYVVPFADTFDEQQETPQSLIDQMAKDGHLGALVPLEYGGAGLDPLKWGLFCEELGRSSASLLSLVTVQSMAIQTLVKWGSTQQKEKWLPKLATGETIAAFGLTEPSIGSDARNIESSAVRSDDGNYVINGKKRWISFGATASLYLVFVQLNNMPVAFLVERDTKGFTAEPIKGMLGFRSANLADLSLQDVQVGEDSMVGKPGFGFSHIAATALDQGRYSIAWGCVGLSQAALEASMDYASNRVQFGKPLVEHQLIQEMLTEMIVETKAARMLCMHASFLKSSGEPSLIMETSTAKYYASKAATKSTNSAVQIHGANGCSSDFPVQRYFRDARIMEIIEGSSQMQQIIIAKAGHQEFTVQQRERNAQSNRGKDE